MAVLFDPFRTFDLLTDWLWGSAVGDGRVGRFVPVDFYRAGDRYVVSADLPGIDPASLDVRVENGTLVIEAERPMPGDADLSWLANERVFGHFMRQLGLPEGVDADRIEATYHDGVLTVVIPLAEQAKPRRIAIQRAEERGEITSHAA